MYDSTKQLRYGHLMIMTDQDHDGSHIKGLIMNFLHHFYPSLLQVNGFLLEFITPIVKVRQRCLSRPASSSYTYRLSACTTRGDGFLLEVIRSIVKSGKRLHQGSASSAIICDLAQRYNIQLHVMSVVEECQRPSSLDMLLPLGACAFVLRSC